MKGRLLAVTEAAEILGVPAKSLLREAERHGHLIHVGRSVRIKETELEELIEKCRSQPKAPASSSAPEPDARPSGSSKTPASLSAARAQATAEMLKGLSRTTSPRKGGKVVPLDRAR